ncbi:hypothetical protein IMZ48_07305 [Candidatus Bathyarchaeota archaeon]|nr:hypothetical protein [Candidatus Bathyarchaeota archaeon]
MHSGIGPKEHMQEFNLPCIKDLPAITQGLRDHMFCPLVYKRKEGDTERAPFYGDQKVMDTAFEQWQKDGTGPWAKFGCEMGIGYFKLDNLASTEEFKALPASEQAYLTKETVPHYEVLTHFPIHWFIPGFPEDSFNYSCILVFYMNAQARGQVTLQSSDPDTPLKHDPKFLSEPFDRRVAIDALREGLRFAGHEGYAKNTDAVMAGPSGDSDEELLDYWGKTLSSSWHMTGTVKMGKPGDEDAAVDSDFRVRGIENLRVADMSVVPVLVNAHVQSVAYATGATCAEKLVAEYELA